MNGRTSTAIAVFVLLCVACVVHAVYYYPRLPEQVAYHFGVSGQPDAWGSKMHFLILYLVTVALMAAIFLGLGFAIPKIPNRAINIPNKDYWLAPERRQKTLEYILPLFFWLGSFTMIFLLYLFHQSFQVDLGKAPNLSHFVLSIGVYLVFTTIWCIAIYRKFSKHESQ
jgi:uncharacterized membrane protein